MSKSEFTHRLFTDPSSEMLKFAALRGGVGYDDSRQEFRDRVLAHDLLATHAKPLLNTTTNNGDPFWLDCQVFQSDSRNAVYSKPGQWSLIGYYEGLMRALDEVALLCVVGVVHGRDVRSVLGDLQLFGNSSWSQIGYDKKFDSEKARQTVRKHTQEGGDQDIAIFVTNGLLFFVLAHELAHATRGHSRLLLGSDYAHYLGEAESKPPANANTKWLVLSELSADYVAVQRLFGTLTQYPDCLGPAGGISLAKKHEILYIGILMLFSLWFVDACEQTNQSVYSATAEQSIRPELTFDGRHPVVTERIAYYVGNTLSKDFVGKYVPRSFNTNVDIATRFLNDQLGDSIEVCAARHVLRYRNNYLSKMSQVIKKMSDEELPYFSAACGPFAVSEA